MYIFFIMKRLKHITPICILSFIYNFSSVYATDDISPADTIYKEVILFKSDSHSIDSSYVNNKESLSSLDWVLNSQFHKIKKIDITASSSPDGSYEYNKSLASKRADALKDYFLNHYPHIDPQTINTLNTGENWNELLNLINKDNNIPQKNKVIEIIRQDINLENKKNRLKQVANGESWSYIKTNLLRELRSACTEITILIERKDNIVSQVESTDEQTNDTISTVETTKAEEPRHTHTIQKEDHEFLALKTNLAAYAFGIANLGIEIATSNKLSVDVPVYYSPYTLAPNYRFRILGFEPELKYWFNKPFRGHSVGLHGIAVMYNISFNKRDRFQNTNGENFVLGGGVSYGYTMKMGRNWNIEFTAGVGYLHLDHDVFHNVKNGALYDNRKFHYWGPTKLGINIIYLFNKR